MELTEIIAYYTDELDTFQVFLEDLGYSTFTLKSYTNDIKLFLAFLYQEKGDLTDLEAVSKRDVMNFLRKQHRQSSKSTRNRRLMAVRSFYRALIKSEILADDPTADVDMAKQDKNDIPIYLNDDELGEFFKSIPKGEFYVRNKCMLMLMSLTGLRVVEIHNLNVTDIKRDQNNPGIQVFGKGNQTRYVPLQLELYQLLLAYEERHRVEAKAGHENAFFLSKRGSRISRRRIQEVAEATFDELKKQQKYTYLKAKNLSSHKLRHTFGTGLVRDGANIVTIQQLMGHSNLNTTQIYTHVNNEQKQSAIRNKNVKQFFDE